MQLGRAYALSGHTDKARNAYNYFLVLWKDADPALTIDVCKRCYRAMRSVQTSLKAQGKWRQAKSSRDTYPRDPAMTIIAFSIFLKEVDEYLKIYLTGSDQERDRLIFWPYFRQGMSTKEIASLPNIKLSAKGVGSVIERLKQAIREQILGTGSPSDDDESVEAKQIALRTRIGDVRGIGV